MATGELGQQKQLGNRIARASGPKRKQGAELGEWWVESNSSRKERPSKPSLSCTLIEEAISTSQEDLQKGDDDALYTLKEETKEDETICMKESGQVDVFEIQKNQDVADEVILQSYKILSLCG